jgi:hypothetical protein
VDEIGTDLVGKPHMVGAFREFLCFFVLFIPVLEEKY